MGAEPVRSEAELSGTPQPIDETYGAPPAVPPSAPPTTPGELKGLIRQSNWPNVIGIGTIVIASIAILANLWGVISSLFLSGFSTAMAGPFGDPTVAEVMQRQWIFNGVSCGIKLLTAIFLLIVGIAILHRQPGSRKLAIVYGCIQILVAAGYSLGGAMLQAETMRVMMSSQAGSGGAGSTVVMTGFGPVFGFVTFIFSFAFSGGFAVFLLIWFNRQKIRREIGTWEPD